VSAGSDAIPAELWQRVVQFLADQRTGTITLRVDRGRVDVLNIVESYRPPWDDR
jgi:hypothetical protein